MSLYWASLLQIDGRLVGTAHASWVGAAMQAVAVGILFGLHELTPFRVLMLQWLLNGSTWLLLLACRRAGLVSLRPDRVLLWRSVAFGVKAYGAQAIFYLVLRVDQVLARGYAGFSQLGLYTLAEMLWLMTDPLAAGLVPHQVRASSGHGHRFSFAMARRSLWISMIAAAAAWLLAPLAIRVVYGSAFVGAAPALRLLPGVVALGATRPLRAMLVKEGRAVTLTVLGLGVLCANVFLNLVLLPRIGIRGSSIASSVCYAAPALSYVVLARRQARPRVRDDDPLRVTFVVGTLNRGGTEQQILLLGSALAARGHQVTVICLVSAGHQGAMARAAGIRIAEIGFPSLHRSAAQALRAQARELGIDEEVDFLGSVADVPALLDGCLFTVLPSLTEGMPNAVLESLAHRRPVIASAVGGVPVILSRGGGILVRPGDPEALVEAMG